MAHVLPVDDLDDPRLAPFLRLTDVALRTKLEPELGVFLAESEKVIRRAVAAGYPLRSVLSSARWAEPLADVLDPLDVPVYLADDEQLAALTGFAVHRGALACMGRRPLPDVDVVLRDARTVVVLEDIVDHTNVGAIFRSVAGLGADAVLVTPRCADPLYRRSVRVSMGTVLQVPWTRVPWPDGLQTLRRHGFSVAALALADDAVPLPALAADRPDRLALLLGTEGDGLRPASVSAADVVTVIPMGHGVDSLNVAAAAAVALYAVTSA